MGGKTLGAARFTRHLGPVTCVTALPNQQGAVSSGYDSAVGYVDLERRTVALLGYHDHLVNRVAVNAAGTRAASASSDYTIALWDIQTRLREKTLLGHSDDVEDFIFVDDQVGVSVSRDHRILVWDLDSGAILRTLLGHEKDVLSVVYAGGRIYTSGDDKTLRSWDLESGNALSVWGPFEAETDTCAIDSIHGRAVLGCDDGFIRIFALDSGQVIAEIQAHEAGIKKVAVSPKTGEILSAAYDQRIRLWHAEELKLRVDLEARRATWERSINWFPDGSRILAGTFDGTILVWDSADGRCLEEIGEPGSGNACLNDVSANAAGEIATASDDGFVRLSRLTRDTSVCDAAVEPTTGRTLANAITLDDERVVAGTHDQKLHIFRKRSGKLDSEIVVDIGRGPINCVRVSHHPRYQGDVFVACYAGAIVRVGLDATIRDEFRIHDGAVKALRLHPTEEIGVSCSADGAVLSWTLQGDVLARFPGHTGIVDDVDIDPSGKRMASVSRDFTLNVYDLLQGKLLQSIPLERRSPKSICFLDPRTVVVSTYWGALLRVDLDRLEICRRRVAKNGISAIAKNGDHLVAVSYDGNAYLVRSDNLEVVNRLHMMTQRLQPSTLF